MSERAVDNAWGTLTNLQALIRFSDSKALAVIVVDGTLIGVGSLVSAGAPFRVLVPAGATIVCAVVSLVLAVISLVPTIQVTDADSVVFFNPISKRSHPRSTHGELERLRAQFESDFKDVMANDSRLLDELAEQVWANSTVAAKKFQAVKRAMWWSIVATGIALLAILIILVGMHGLPASHATPGGS